MITLKKGDKIIKVQNDKIIIDAFLTSGYVVVNDKETVNDKRFNATNKKLL